MASVVQKQNADGSMGLQGEDRDNGGFVNINVAYNASSVDQWAFVATRAYVVQGINACPSVAGTDAGGVTVIVGKATGTNGIVGSTQLHSSVINLKGTINTNQPQTLSTTAGVTKLAAGDRIAIDYVGVLTSAVGVITICLAPA